MESVAEAQGDGAGFYDTLGCHRSWVALLVTFIFDPRYSLNTRSENVEHAAHVTDVAASRRSESMTFETKNIGGETPEQLSASPRLFESDLLDKLSRVHHLTPVIIYTPIIFGLTIYSLTLQGVAAVALGLFVGYIAWTLTEYFGHRYLFHTVFALPFGLGPRFQFLIHGVHHIYPSYPLRLVMPPLLSATIMLLALAVIRLLFGGPCSVGRCWRDSSAAM